MNPKLVDQLDGLSKKQTIDVLTERVDTLERVLNLMRPHVSEPIELNIIDEYVHRPLPI